MIEEFNKKFPNWKTTTISAAASVALSWANGGFDGSNPKIWISSFLIAWFGYYAKG